MVHHAQARHTSKLQDPHRNLNAKTISPCPKQLHENSTVVRNRNSMLEYLLPPPPPPACHPTQCHHMLPICWITEVNCKSSLDPRLPLPEAACLFHACSHPLPQFPPSLLTHITLPRPPVQTLYRCPPSSTYRPPDLASAPEPHQILMRLYTFDHIFHAATGRRSYSYSRSPTL